MIVLDSAAAVDLLLERDEPGEWVVHQIAGQENVAAPHLFDVEVLSALRRLVAAHEVSTSTAREALIGLGELGVVRYPVNDLLERMWRLRSAVTAYDAAYVVLAEALAVTLVTTDARLARSHGHHARIVAYAG